MSYDKLARLPLLVALAFLPFLVIGQSSNTPYSRYGIGELHGNTNMLNMAMGGTSLGIRNPLFVNPYNPASYTSFDSTSFIFDAALYGKIMTLKTNSASEKINDAGLSYITMGFPITRWWKTSFGLLPFSSTGYQIGIDSVVENFGKVQYGYSGSGGLNRAYFGNGFQPFKHLSVGFNLSYIFGTISKTRTLSFPDSTNHFSSMLDNSIQVRSLIMDFGVQYHNTLKNGLDLTTGLTFSPGQTLTGKTDFLAVTYYHNYSSNLDVMKDTSYYETGKKGKISYPMKAGAGFSLGRTNRWNAGADVEFQNWSDFRYFGASDSLKNSLRISVGGQYRPSPLDVGSYWKRVNYRLGFKFQQSYLELRNTRLNEFGIGFGLGLPMKKSRSTINLAFEVGTFGSTDNKLIKENYFRFSIGSSMFEKWFLKRKYD